MRDPDGRGLLTLEDLRYSTLPDLFRIEPVRDEDDEVVPDVVDVSFGVALPSSLAGGATDERDGTLSTGVEDIPEGGVWPIAADATRDYGHALTRATGLSMVDGLSSLAQYTGTVLALQDAADVPFPNLSGGTGDLFAPGDKMLDLLSTAAAAQIQCGAAPREPARWRRGARRRRLLRGRDPRGRRHRQQRELEDEPRRRHCRHAGGAAGHGRRHPDRCGAGQRFGRRARHQRHLHRGRPAARGQVDAAHRPGRRTPDRGDRRLTGRRSTERRASRHRGRPAPGHPQRQPAAGQPRNSGRPGRAHRPGVRGGRNQQRHGHRHRRVVRRRVRHRDRKRGRGRQPGDGAAPRGCLAAADRQPRRDPADQRDGPPGPDRLPRCDRRPDRPQSGQPGRRCRRDPRAGRRRQRPVADQHPAQRGRRAGPRQGQPDLERHCRHRLHRHREARSPEPAVPSPPAGAPRPPVPPASAGGLAGCPA